MRSRDQSEDYCNPKDVLVYRDTPAGIVGTPIVDEGKPAAMPPYMAGLNSWATPAAPFVAEFRTMGGEWFNVGTWTQRCHAAFTTRGEAETALREVMPELMAGYGRVRDIGDAQERALALPRWRVVLDMGLQFTKIAYVRAHNSIGAMNAAEALVRRRGVSLYDHVTLAADQDGPVETRTAQAQR